MSAENLLLREQKLQCGDLLCKKANDGFANTDTVSRRGDILQHVAAVSEQLAAWDHALPARHVILNVLEVGLEMSLPAPNGLHNKQTYTIAAALRVAARRGLGDANGFCSRTSNLKANRSSFGTR